MKPISTLTSKAMARDAFALSAIEGGSQCPARIHQRHGTFLPIEKVIEVHNINIQMLVCTFCCKEALGKNQN